MLKYRRLPGYSLKKKCDKVFNASGGKEMWLLKFSLFIAVAAVGMTVFLVKPVTCQEHSQVNSPPILVVPDRNWRISETEPVGQVISRIRANDSEKDELVFGLELAYKGTVNPFRIDPVAGVVYLNQSLIGRGGENFFLYITVTDGKLTAKNEVYVNILSAEDNSGHRIPAISMPQSVHNTTNFLPSFGSLPGVQSIRKQQSNRRPSYVLQPGLNNFFFPTISNFNPNHQVPFSSIDSGQDERDINYSVEVTTQQSISTTTRRTKLTPISYGSTSIPASKTSVEKELNATELWNTSFHSINTTSVFYNFRSQTFRLLLTAFGLFVAAAVIVGFMYRKRLCAFGKTLRKTSKEKLAKKSNQSNLSTSHLTDNSHNSMIMQQWNGPRAFGNRYVPCEIDQQLQQQIHTQQHLLQQPIATIQLSDNIANGALDTSHPAGLGVTVSGPSSTIATVTSAGIYRFGERYLTQQQIHDVWEFPRHRLKFFNILGEGAFGQVWRCEATEIGGSEGVTTVAVKTIRENATEVERKDLISELEVMKSLEPHLNVVRFLGCCTDKDPIFVIMEYVNRGKLQTYLRSSRAERHYGNTHGKSNILTSGDLTSFMYQIAKGMDYLTSRGIIHRDLAARNVLITDDHTCKVADFGFARDIITSKIYERKSEGKLPIRWMAIESLYDNIFSVKSDIWSFGILMWEIVTLGATPYPGVSASEVMRKVQSGYRLEKPEHCRRELYNIMYYCWSHDPSERPSFGELIKMLDKLLHTEMDYIELERFPDHNYYNILSLSGEKV